MLKDSLSAIGARIEAVVAAKNAKGDDGEKWRKHLWMYVTFLLFLLLLARVDCEFVSSFSFVTLFWPREVKHSKLQAIHAKITGSSAPTTSGAASSSKI
jgi:chromodomain-helicase-DNA-binding protein 1